MTIRRFGSHAVKQVLNFIIGTKAQFIKMAPVVREAESRGLACRIIDLGQHAGITGKIVADFGIASPVIQVLPGQQTVSDYLGAARWLARIAKHLAFPSGLRKVVTGKGVALVHGDTLSTLAGTMIARRLGLTVGLVEAGLTSGRLWSPFPEEVIRRLCERLSDVLFAPGETPEAYLLRNRRRGVTVNTLHNTGRDALFMQMRDKAELDYSNAALVTLHRLETLRSTRRLARAVSYIEDLATHMPVTLLLHPPTRIALQSKGLLERIMSNPDISTTTLLPYPDFLQLLVSSRIVLTDGGSIQEECSYLGKKCVVLRDVTERAEGIGKNAILTTWSAKDDLDALAQLPPSARPEEDSDNAASRVIVDFVSQSTQAPD